MKQSARLITPRGKMIELSPEIYRQVQQLLTNQKQRRSRARMTRAIRETYGKYKGGKSLTAALLEERAAERAREDAKQKRFYG